MMLSTADVHVQPMDCKALAQGREPLLKVALIQLPDQGSILSVTLAHCMAGKCVVYMLPVSCLLSDGYMHAWLLEMKAYAMRTQHYIFR